MTCLVHNVKFYKLDPKGINCMSYENERKRLALSRSDGLIEIWDLSNSPYVERTIPSGSNSSIESLAWYADRLFSVGLTAHLIEYDLRHLGHKYSIPITGGVGWSMDIHHSGKLIIGTEQGYLNVYDVTIDGAEYVKVCDKQEGRILCLKFDESGDFVASGSVDTIRVWNIKTGHAIHKMNLSRQATNTETVVWCLAIADNFTIISGDSRGYLSFWDGHLGVQIISYHSHSSSVLSVCLSEDKRTVYCAGVDPLIISYEKIMINKSEKWVRSVHRKIHKHDVRTLLTTGGNKLYSGGVDGYLACSYFPPKTLLKYPPVLQNPCICIARERKFLLLRYHRSIEVWHLGTEPTRLLEIFTKRDEGTLCANISNNGKWLMYSTLSKIRLFQFQYDGKKAELNTVSSSSADICKSCTRAEFTPNNKQLIMAAKDDECIQVLNIISENNICLAQTIDTSKYLKDTITFLKISACGKYIIAADPDSNIVILILNEQSWEFQYKLPKYRSPPTALGIHPTLNQLLVVYSDHKIIEWSLKEKEFTKFSRGLNQKLPRQWFKGSLPVINVTYDPRADHIVLLHDDSSINVIDKDKELPKTDAKIPKLDSSNNEFNSEHAIHMIKKYKHLVYFDWIANGEMVAVELNPLYLLEKLPPCLQKKKFGTK